MSITCHPSRCTIRLWLYFMLLSLAALQTETFPSSPSLTQLFHSASGVDPLILAWQRGKDTDGTLLVNLICKSKMFSLSPPPPLCFSSSRTPTLTFWFFFFPVTLSQIQRVPFVAVCCKRKKKNTWKCVCVCVCYRAAVS